MLENLINFDTNLFYLINQGMASTVTNFCMPILTKLSTWAPLLAVFCIYQIWKGGENGKICIAAIIVGVIICDQFSSSILKEIFQRPRPCHVLTDINLLVNCGAGKSFPSSHAGNSMMGVVMIALFFRKHKFWLPIISIIIGISRIFVGVHYPLDVLCGWILGALVAFFTYWLVNYCYSKYIKPRLKNKTENNAIIE